MKSFRIFAFFLAFLMAAGTGCSKKAPDPPMVRGELILEIFYAIDRKDYKTALSRTKRLHTLDPSNSNLAELEQVLECNIPLREASERFKKGKRDQAVKLIEDAIRHSGNVKQLEDAMNDMRQISRLNELTEKIDNPASSVELASSLAEYRTLAEGHPELADLLAFAEIRSRKVAPVVRAREEKLMVFYVENDLNMLSRMNPERKPGYDAQKENIPNFFSKIAVQLERSNSTKRER